MQTTYEGTCVNLFSAIRTQNKIVESRAKISGVLVEDSLGLHKISEKFSRNSFSLKFHVRISTEFGTKRDRFQVETDKYSPRKKIKQYHTQTNLASSHGSDEWKIYYKSCRTNLGLKSQPNSVDTMRNVWSKFEAKIRKE